MLVSTRAMGETPMLRLSTLSVALRSRGTSRQRSIEFLPMRIDQILSHGKPAVSFEFFPPKNEQGFAQLYQTIEDLRPLNPSYVSVTYGAGGSTRQKTVDLV